MMVVSRYEKQCGKIRMEGVGTANLCWGRREGKEAVTRKGARAASVCVEEREVLQLRVS